MQSILWEVVIIGSMVFVAGAVLHHWAYKKGLFSEWEEESQQRVQSEKFSDDERDEESNPFVKKWLTFGGGYYGTVAFVQLLIIEFNQVKAMASDWQGVSNLTDNFGLGSLISLAVGIFVEQFHNFAQAISWPAHYVSNYPISQCAIFVVVTYLIFRAAQHLAWNRFLKADEQNPE